MVRALAGLLIVDPASARMTPLQDLLDLPVELDRGLAGRPRA
jgi:hypothetical protein